MTRDIENNSKSLLAMMVVELELESRSKFFNQITSGLTPGTAERKMFDDSYTDANIKLQSIKKNDKLTNKK